MTVGFLGGKFLPFHQGHLYMILRASTMVDKLYVVLTSSQNRDKELCDRDGIKYMPADVRMSWIGASVADLENIDVINIIDDQWNDNYNWEEGSNKIRQAIPEKLTHVFSSEPEYDKYFKAYYPGTEHIVVDEGRNAVSISATELRRDLYKHWDMLPVTVRPFFVKKVVLIGTESCGKSTLTKKLAKFYNTNFVHEVGKDDYTYKYKNFLTPEMFISTVMDHFRLIERRMEVANKVVFIDTEAVVTQFYLEVYTGQKSALIDEVIKLQEFDLILYMEPDVKWVDDGTRFLGADEQRSASNAKLKKMFDDYGFKYITVSGNYEERFKKARELVAQVMEA